MKDKTIIYGLISTGFLFLGVPFFLYFTGDIAARTVLKDALSIITILALVLMLGQFYLTRTFKLPITGATMGKIMSLHIVTGYLGAAVLLVHPFLIVVPRYFEAGISPCEAFITIITTQTPGVTTGIMAWILLLLISVLSILRNKIPLRYKDWRRLHGLMSAAFISLAAGHAVYLGRHMNQALGIYIVIQVIAGIFFLIRRYSSELYKKGDKQQWVLPETSTACPGEIL